MSDISVKCKKNQKNSPNTKDIQFTLTTHWQIIIKVIDEKYLPIKSLQLCSLTVGPHPLSARLWLLSLPSSSAQSGVSPAPSSSLSEGVCVCFSLGWIATDAVLPGCIRACLYVCQWLPPLSPSWPRLSHIHVLAPSESSHTLLYLNALKKQKQKKLPGRKTMSEPRVQSEECSINAECFLRWDDVWHVASLHNIIKV